MERIAIKCMEWILKIVLCYWPAILFQLVRSGVIKFNGWPYNNPPHTTVILIIILAICNIPVVFMVKWSTKALD